MSELGDEGPCFVVVKAENKQVYNNMHLLAKKKKHSTFDAFSTQNRASNS